MLNQLNTTTKRELDTRYLAMQGSKEVTSTSGTISIPDYGLTENIELYFKPTQDMHGYDKPWAGGAGKNKFIYPYPTSSSSVGGVTWTITPYEIHITGTTSTAELTIVLAGKSRKTWGNVDNAVSLADTDGSYTFSGGTSRVPLLVYQYRNGVRVQEYSMTSATTIEIEASDLFEIGLEIQAGIVYDDNISPQIELGQTATAFEPYSNICPISGQDKASLTWDTNQGISMNFGTTYYGGIANFEGVLSLDWQHIASYDGESLTGEWLSDRDKYVSGTTPSTGAEVVYKTTPTTVRVTKPTSLNLTDDYPITYNGYKLDVTYQPKDTILEEAKTYTNQEIEKLGLPQAPTSNGTYNLVCTVASGVPTISWKSTT